MDLRPANLPLKVWRNDTLALNFELKVEDEPIDLSSATIRMQIRPDYGSNTLTLSLTEGNGITVTGTSNNMVALNKVITIASGEYVYDLEAAFANGDVKTYVKGEFIVSEDSTK